MGQPHRAGRLGLLFGAPQVLAKQVGVNEVLAGPPRIWVPLYGLLLLGLLVLLSADYVRGRPRTPAEERATVLGAAPLVVSLAILTGVTVLSTDVRWERFVPVCVVVAGTALLVGAWAGRPRPFVTPAVVAVAVLGTWVASGARLDGGVGDVRIAPTRVDGGALEVRRAIGDVDVDLRRTVSSEPIVLRASVGKGTLRVALPSGTLVRVDARVGQGRPPPHCSPRTARVKRDSIYMRPTVGAWTARVRLRRPRSG